MSHYSELDWMVFGLYGLLLLGSGWLFNRRSLNSKDYFLGGNKMPVWVVAISILATAQSAATFLGGPDQGYRSDFSYLASNLGAFIAAMFVASYLLPKFYQLKVYTVYELLEQRFGSRAKKHAGAMYLFGRVFASGSRLYMAAIAVSMILFGSFAAQNVVLSILILVSVGLLYTIYGGIRTVIYSDVMQCAIYVSAAGLVLFYLLDAIPADFASVLNLLDANGDGQQSKLALFHFDWDFSSAGVFNFWSILTGLVLLNIAAFGLDQDMTQRALTCGSARQGGIAMLSSVILVIPVMLIFIFIGMLLFVFYHHPELMLSEHNLQEAPSFQGEPVTIFMYYVLNEIPAGVKGFVTVGIVAAALSSLNSGLNSMSSVLIQDLYRPWREQGSQPLNERHYVRAGQIGMAIVAAALALMASLCYYWQQYSDMPLLQFALSVMVFSYSGLLGVYFAALFTRRGSVNSVTMALVTGFIMTLLFQPYVMTLYLPAEYQFDLGFSWQLCIGTFASFTVCIVAAGTTENDHAKDLEKSSAPMLNRVEE